MSALPQGAEKDQWQKGLPLLRSQGCGGHIQDAASRKSLRRQKIVII
jgi:hypothetical protein